MPERLERARRNGVETFDLQEHEKDLGDAIREATDGRGPDSVIDAVGMEAHGAPFGKLAHTLVGFLPDAIAAKMMETAASTGSTRSTSRSTSSAAAARSRSAASTAARPARCR